MANSKYEYVRTFETPDSLLPDTWIVIRIDGRGFHKLSAKYGWEKPNDRRAIDLMNEAAKGVMREVQELVVAYGQSDEYSFIFPPSTSLFDRRASKLTTTLVSTFTSYYTHFWPSFFPSSPLSPLTPLPSFDARAIVYPTLPHLRDYLSWRQADCHINNLYNTTFWALVQQGGRTHQEAERELKGTVSSDKNELLWRTFGVNYNGVESVWRKGSVVYRDMRARASVGEGAGDGGVGAAGGDGATDADGRSKVMEMEDGEERDGNAVPAASLTAEIGEAGAAEAHAIEGADAQMQSLTLEREAPAQAAAKTRTVHASGHGISNKPLSKTQLEKRRKRRLKAVITIEHVDIIKDTFWDERPWILSDS